MRLLWRIVRSLVYALTLIVEREVEVFGYMQIAGMRRLRMMVAGAELVLAIILRGVFLEPCFYFGGKGIFWGLALGIGISYIFWVPRDRVGMQAVVLGMDLFICHLMPLSVIAEVLLFPVTLAEIFAESYGIGTALVSVPLITATVSVVLRAILPKNTGEAKGPILAFLSALAMNVALCALYFRFGFLSAFVASCAYYLCYLVGTMANIYEPPQPPE